MAQLKTRKADLIGKYKITFEISLIFSLALVIGAFKYFPDIKKVERIFEAPQEIITLQDILQTKQETLPPPPPKPAIIVAVPSDDFLKDVEIESSELNVNETVALPPPAVVEHRKIIESEPQYFVIVERMPEPVGGIAAIQSKIVYPEIALRAGVSGKVYILAFVDETGSVTKVQVLKGIGAGCDEAALKAVKETKFIPGKQRDVPVKVQVVVPVIFQIDQNG